jgi:hypothetical protein
MIAKQKSNRTRKRKMARDKAGEASWNCEGKEQERKEGGAKEIAVRV